MSEQEPILVKNGFVRIVDVTGEVTKKRLEMMEELADYKKSVAKRLSDFKKKSLSSNEAWLKFLKDRNLQHDSLAIPTFTFSSSYLHVLRANVGRIVQVYGNVHTDENGLQDSKFCAKAFIPLHLSTATMYLEKVDGPEVEEYKPFYIEQIVRLKNYNGIKYPVASMILANNAFYPDIPEVSDLVKQHLFKFIAGEKLIVWLVEPGEKRVLVVPENWTLSDPENVVVYVRPDALEIV